MISTSTNNHTGLAIPENPLVPRLYRVERVHQETEDTWTLEIEPVDGVLCPRYAPGQFNMLYVFGTGELPVSISGDPAWHTTLVHTVRAVGQATTALCALKPGGIVGVRGPFGTSWPEEELYGKDVLIVAGGIGLAPLRPSIYSIMSNRNKYKHVSILYGARAPRHLLYKSEIEYWRDRPDLYIGVTVDTAEQGWTGMVGVVPTLISKAQFDPDNTAALVVGPEIMMRFTLIELQKRGVKPENIYISMERSMKCGMGVCWHCMLGPKFVCKDGPVFRYSDIATLFNTREV